MSLGEAEAPTGVIIPSFAFVSSARMPDVRFRRTCRCIPAIPAYPRSRRRGLLVKTRSRHSAYSAMLPPRGTNLGAKG